MKKSILVAFGALFFGFFASAQIMNRDSLSLVSKINSYNEKLAKMQSSVDEKTRQKQETANKAQQSADDNKTAANNLSNNPQDRKLAKRADNAASDARSDAKRARKASDQLDGLNKDIVNMTDKIAKEQTKLNKYTQKSLDAAPAVVMPVVPKDSTKN